MKRKATPTTPLNDVLHQKLLQYLRKFIIIGGMPEVVANYIEIKDINQAFLTLNDLKNSYFDDFAKYKKRVPVKRIRDVFKAVVMQNGSKFIYSKTESDDNQKQIKEALNLLILAGIVTPIVHTSANGFPLGAEINPKKKKMLLMDTGLYLNILNLNLGEIMLADDLTTINKGSLTELFVGTELLKYESPFVRSELFYWHREAKSSNAEVDYIINKQNIVTPIEVKSGSRGSMQSLNLFLEQKKLNKGIRVSAENFSSYGKIDVYPLYALSSLI